MPSGLEAAITVDIRPLTPERFADLAVLFEEGGDPKWCWCQFYRVRNLDWTSNPAVNRARLEALAHDGPPPGLVAYAGDRAVGWVSLAERERYDRLTTAKVLARVDNRPVWSIVCFVVSRTRRRSGIAAALLDAAIAHAKASGATTLGAYPADTGGRKVPSANVFNGTLTMFEKAGFEVVALRQATKTSVPRPIVRLEL
ncbi:MAG: GNAT family N-acetyltransferase [Chloroflexi bacterium]|nr:GNAT family N-acetyltransferase [Chloroflexota bacterium]